MKTKKLEKLNESQITKLPFYRDKWIKIGLSTDRSDRPKCHQIIQEIYKAAGLQDPKIKIWLDSPYQGMLAVGILAAGMLPRAKSGEAELVSLQSLQLQDPVLHQVRQKVQDQVWTQMRDKMGNQVLEQVREQVRDQALQQAQAQVREQVQEQVREQVREQMLDPWLQVGNQVLQQVREQVLQQVQEQVREQVYDQVYDQVLLQVRAQVGNQVWAAGYGSHDSGWLSFYDFFEKECGIPAASTPRPLSTLRPLMNLAENCGWFWPFKNAVVFTERPTEIHRNPSFRLHNFNSAALKYADGFCLYRFNGVTVSKQQCETPADGFTKEMILDEKNSDVRRELIRKIGIERAIQILNAKVIDRMDDYELLLLDLGDKRDRPYLKMKNPSIDAVHIEGCPPGTKTVIEALCWRNGLTEWTPPLKIS